MKYAIATITLLFTILSKLQAQSDTSINTLQLELKNSWVNPPLMAKPYVWWHWMGSNFSKYGITKDLEAMKAEGIGGATIFNLTSAVQESGVPTENLPFPTQTYRSKAYWEALKFAAAEADRLGLEVGLHNSVGYSTTGGPWITEDKGMRKIAWTSTTINGSESAIAIQLSKPSRPLKKEADYTHQVLDVPNTPIPYFKDIAVLAIPLEDSTVIPFQHIINLSAFLRPNDSLYWKAPKGKWLIYRFGSIPTLVEPHPIPDELIGKALEVDKMNANYNRFHWGKVVDSIQQYLGGYLGKSFKHLLIDSYESGYQNWTDCFRDSFIAMRGYDPVPWLVSLSNPINNVKSNPLRKPINNETDTKRFEWDYFDVINRLFYSNGWNIGKQITNKAHLQLQFEPYGGPFDMLEGAALADIPMGEFWTHGKGGINTNIPAAARAAGKNIIGAESFTGLPNYSRYTEDPAYLKLSMEGTFSSGVNHLVLHHWVHQPFDDAYQPGMGMGWWGTHFSRHQTWATPAKAFFTYIARSQALLQFGEQVVDYLCIEKPDGFCDLIAPHSFLTAPITVDAQHRIHLPSGRVYRWLGCPNGNNMLPEIALKLQSLIAQGAIVIAPKPIASPSLSNASFSDSIVKNIGNEVWGNEPQHAYKKGWVFNSLKVAQAYADYTPDYTITIADSIKDIRVIHRKKGNTHVFYIANLNKNPQPLTIHCAVKGLQPELWQAEDSSITNATIWEQDKTGINVPLSLKGYQSTFLVFKSPITAPFHATSVEYPNQTTTPTFISLLVKPALIFNQATTATIHFSNQSIKTVTTTAPVIDTINGNWTIAFTPKLGKPFKQVFTTLTDFSVNENNDIKYFAGTATYTQTIHLPQSQLNTQQRIILDLGTVNDIVQITLNKKDLGVLWYPPYTLDITDNLQVGTNTVQIAVTNNWANRLIGDEQESADITFGKERPDRGRPLKAYPDWFIAHTPRLSSGRTTFTTWFYYKKDSPLQPAGLVGPVVLKNCTVVPLY